jgi:dihydroorotate dehydrogenase electron transfer subunit
MSYRKMTIEKIVDECKDVKTFLFNETMKAEPGQFVMAWIPGKAEKPFSISYSEPFGFTAKKFSGPESVFTPALFDLKVGDSVWIRGPYGKHFPVERLNNSRVCIIGGGTGIAPLSFLAERLKNSEILSFLGTKTSNDLFFDNRLRKIAEVNVATEDGSRGTHGMVTDILLNLPKNSKAAICGPDKMIFYSAKILEKFARSDDIFVSLERYMKCGSGLCGSCDFGGLRICVDGPVFSYSAIRDVPDFGNFKRDVSGTRVKM